MSEEQLKAFLEAVKADAVLQERIKSAGGPHAVLAIAKAAGYIINSDGPNNVQSEIIEEELEGVVGGQTHETLMRIFGPTSTAIPDLEDYLGKIFKIFPI